MIECNDSLEYLKTKQDYEFDINYSDPPYALGSEVMIRPDGKVDYKKANDFMSKWEMPTGAYWEQWFKEVYRTLKHGGYCVMFGMDRQLLLFKYYANLAGFEEQQSLYWYFISNFPKATDLSKQIDKNNGKHNYLLQFTKWFDEYCTKHKLTNKQIDDYLELSSGGSTSSHYRGWNTQQPRFPRLNLYYKLKDWLGFGDEWDEIIKEAEREVIGKNTNVNNTGGWQEDFVGGKVVNANSDITAPSTDLAKKYEGYKYSISPLKQTNETIMVFQKPYKTGSCLHDTLAFENGNNECRCGALNIDGNRVEVGINENIERKHTPKTIWGFNENPKYDLTKLGQVFTSNEAGRYPSQTFCDSNTAEVLDKQSGKTIGSSYRPGNRDSRKATFDFGSQDKTNQGYTDTGGCSKILHKCDFRDDEHDLYFYNPKVSKSERNAGCDEFEEKKVAHGLHSTSYIGEKAYKTNTIMKNNHPTLKPIKLNERILKLFKTPNEQKIIYPFAGSGSEVIGGIKAGFNIYCGCELNQEYVDIALARIEHWTKPEDQKNIFDFIGDE